MGITKKLEGKKVFLDATPLIYFIKGNSKFQTFLDELFRLNGSGKIEFVTSSLTVLQLLVAPLKNNRPDLVKEYERILYGSATLKITAVDTDIAKLAAAIQAKFNFETIDSIQLAAAIGSKCNVFLTNNAHLKQDEIYTLVLQEIPDDQL